MTEALDKPRYLLDRPQRLGFLPSYWFWNDRDNWRFIRAPYAILAGLAVFLVALAELPVPLYVIMLIPPLVLTLALGLFERYIRGRALARERPTRPARAALEQESSPRPGP